MKQNAVSHLGLSKFIWFIFFIIVLVLAGCGPSEATPTVDDESDETPISYPAPEIEQNEVQNGYPAPTQTAVQDQGYPPPSPEVFVEDPYPDPKNPPEGSLLALNKPIQPRDGIITGVGVPGLTIFIINVTAMGEPLGSGVIDEDGTFSVDVGDLESGVQIGLTADIESFGLLSDDIIPGDGEISIPQVGYFFDSVVVREN
jgi:hypothetical protein